MERTIKIVKKGAVRNDSPFNNEVEFLALVYGHVGASIVKCRDDTKSGSSCKNSTNRDCTAIHIEGDNHD